MPNNDVITNNAYFKNYSTYALWRDMLAELTISSIKWENLPPTIDPIYLERQLFYKGQVIFFPTDEGLVCMSGFGTAMPNIYNIPTERVVNAPNGFTATLNNENSVICYNDVLRRNGVYKANIYAGRLSDLDNTIDVNCLAQKTPILLKANKRNELSVKNAYMQVVGNSPVICISDDADPNAISVLQTGAPFTADKMRELQHDIFAEYCTSIGIANSNNYKAERLITSEIYANNAGVLINQQSKLKPRQQVCDILNNSPIFQPYLVNGPVSVKFEVDSVDEILAVTGSESGFIETGDTVGGNLVQEG